jgi:hypothetical protein
MGRPQDSRMLVEQGFWVLRLVWGQWLCRSLRLLLLLLWLDYRRQQVRCLLVGLERQHRWLAGSTRSFTAFNVEFVRCHLIKTI